MKKISFLISLLALAGTFFLTSCDDNDEITVIDPDAEFDVVLEVDEADAANSKSAAVIVDPDVKSTIAAKVMFTSDGSQKRMYITRDIAGAGEEPFDLGELGVSVDDKGDGSIDIEKAGKDTVTYSLNLPVPTDITEGTIVYKFWTTSGKGDFRDDTKRIVTGPGTITLTYGAGTNPTADVKSYSVQLDAPLADGSSSTFISLLDGTVFKINQGEEFVAFWDFGYYYGNTGKATLSSTAGYPSPVIDINEVANTTTDELNNAFFTESSKSSTDFDDVSITSDLNFIAVPTTNAVNALEDGDIIEFVDPYGKKGMIRVVEVKGTFNSGDYIKIDIKIQP